MCNSARKGQILKKISCYQDARTQTLYSPLALVQAKIIKFALTIQSIVLMYLKLVMAEKKLFVNALLHLKLHPSTSLITLVFLTGTTRYIVVKGKEQSFRTDNVIFQTATMNTISASTAKISMKMSYEPSQSLIQKNKFRAE